MGLMAGKTRLIPVKFSNLSKIKSLFPGWFFSILQFSKPIQRKNKKTFVTIDTPSRTNKNVWRKRRMAAKTDRMVAWRNHIGHKLCRPSLQSGLAQPTDVLYIFIVKIKRNGVILHQIYSVLKARRHPVGLPVIKRQSTTTCIMQDNQNKRELNALIEQRSAIVTTLRDGMSQTIVGQRHLVDALIIGLLADGHILLEGVPGLAKTLAIKTLSSLIDADFSRIQFTPDLLPADVVGTQIYSQSREAFEVRKGPVFAHFVLADEINRAPAKVQSALLEAMQERQVTIGDQTFALPSPFLVMATQNPIEQEGTYPLPEAQTDRFMLKVKLDYPEQDEETQIVKAHLDGRFETAKTLPVAGAADIVEAREAVKQIYVDERICRYVADLVFATRTPERYDLPDLKPMIAYGGSPRASINLALAARAAAFMAGRGFVVPDDVRGVVHDVLRHRIGLSYEAEANGLSTDDIIDALTAKVKVP